MQNLAAKKRMIDNRLGMIVLSAVAAMLGLLGCGGTSVPGGPSCSGSETYTRINCPDREHADIHYPRYDFTELGPDGKERPAVNKINLVFVRQQDEESVIDGWYGLSSLNLAETIITELKQELEGSGPDKGWTFSDVHNSSGSGQAHNRKFEVSVSSIEAGEPLGFVPQSSPPVRFADLRMEATGSFSFAFTSNGAVYFLGTLQRNLGTTVKDPDLYSWTIYVYLSAADVSNEPLANGLTPAREVGEDDFGIEGVPHNFSVLYLGNLKKIVDEGFANFTQFGIGSFDFPNPQASAIKNWAKLLIKHEALGHGIQRKVYIVNGQPSNFHCATQNCLLLDGPAMGIVSQEMIGGQNRRKLFVSKTFLDGFKLFNQFSCQRHQLAGNTTTFHDQQFILAP